jgi:hypothetical protein
MGHKAGLDAVKKKKNFVSLKGPIVQGTIKIKSRRKSLIAGYRRTEIQFYLNYNSTGCFSTDIFCTEYNDVIFVKLNSKMQLLNIIAICQKTRA